MKGKMISASCINRQMISTFTYIMTVEMTVFHLNRGLIKGHQVAKDKD